MEKLIVTRWQGRLLTALISGKRAAQLTLEPKEEDSLLNRIYIGKVQTVVESLNAAFVEFKEGQNGYLSLAENKPRILNRQGAKKLRPGDEILVQVEREPVKTKAPVLTCSLSFAGRLCVLTPEKPGINFSSKLKDSQLREALKPALANELKGLGLDGCGVIVRTNAQGQEPSEVCRELKSLALQYLSLLEQAEHRTCYTCLYQGLPGYIASLRDAGRGRLEAIVTDQPDCFDALKQYLEASQPEDGGLLSLYSDPLVSLLKVYSLEKAMSEALGKRVWLKSGGYLVIEYTEAMTVIDVNTGKYSGKKTLQETILKINREAAREIAWQLRLRNLSGIILVDFIDMEREEDSRALMEELSCAAAADPVKTAVVDMTRLGLVEITRKKVLRPFHEQVRDMEEGGGAGLDQGQAASGSRAAKS